MKKKKVKWLDVPDRDMSYWLGQYLLAAMVLQSHSEEHGFPTKIGKFGRIKNQKDGSGLVNFEARWV